MIEHGNGPDPAKDDGSGRTPRGTIEVPRKPTMAMLASAASSAGVSVETAWTVWRAMVAAAEDQSGAGGAG